MMPNVYIGMLIVVRLDFHSASAETFFNGNPTGATGWANKKWSSNHSKLGFTMVYLDGYGSIPRDTIYRDEHPFASYFGVHHGYRVLTHIQIGK